MMSLLPDHLLLVHAAPFGELELKRAWPMGAGHLALEYRSAGGAVVAGQWLRDWDEFDQAARRTARHGEVLRPRARGVLLQPGGVDRRLRGLRPLLEQRGARLLVHRAERRAVVRVSDGERVRFAKVVRPSRLPALATAHEAVSRLGLAAFDTPSLVARDEARGVLWFSALEGESLFDLLGTSALVDAARRAGASLRALHRVTPLAAPRHDAAAEIGVLQKWLGRLELFGLSPQSPFHALARRVQRALAGGGGPRVLLHRDFYDKQILIDRARRVGLLDFDTLAVGEAALDVANALVHFELRALQGHCTPHHARWAAGAFLEGYGPSPTVRRRLPDYAAAARLRLACVYAFRPGSLSDSLLDAAWRELASRPARRVV